MGRAKPVAEVAPAHSEIVTMFDGPPQQATLQPRPHLQWMVNRWRPEGREQRTTHLARPYDGCAMVFPDSIGTYQTVLATQERRQLAVGVVQRINTKLA